MSRSRWLQLLRLVFRTRVLLVCFSMALFQTFPVLAYELNHSVVTEENGIFQIKISAIINAPDKHVRQALSDISID